MSKFKVGDKVKVIKIVDNGHGSCNVKEGDLGIIKSDIYGSYGYPVLFERNINGHSCVGLCQHKFGQWMKEEELMLLSKSHPLTNTIITNIPASEFLGEEEPQAFSREAIKNYVEIPKDFAEALTYKGCVDYAQPSRWMGIGVVEKLEDLEKQRDKIINTNNNTPTEPCVGGKNKIMSLITNALKSKEDKALEVFSLGSEKELTSNGQVEFIQHLYQTLTVERKSFLAKVVEAYKESKNK
jgi:hypothetical protein